ncbi:MAG: hypothetical protein H6836_01950 [Planctomycetes bacterium]|nr:hypothetical protein [Planctomycetota bacterium]MCB9888310.1 hypothetical protein [Planctomycetota bacterium]
MHTLQRDRSAFRAGAWGVILYLCWAASAVFGCRGLPAMPPPSAAREVATESNDASALARRVPGIGRALLAVFAVESDDEERGCLDSEESDNAAPGELVGWVHRGIGGSVSAVRPQVAYPKSGCELLSLTRAPPATQR